MEDEYVAEFCSAFYGYGRWEAPWWFLGMEERGCKTLAEAEFRLKVWRAPEDTDLALLRQTGLIDLHQYHHGLGIDLLQMKLPKTWQYLIRLYLAGTTGKPVTREAVIGVLRVKWGAAEGPTCLAELQPLPCPNRGAWPWPQWCGVEARKQDFEKRVLPKRSQALASNRRHYKPRVVVFYGMGFDAYWQEIAGCRLSKIMDPDVYGGKADGSVFVSIPHLSSRKKGMSYELMGRLGVWVSGKLEAGGSA